MPNNRELALLIWLALFIIWASRKPGMRRALSGLMRAFFARKVFTLVALMVLYLVAVVIGFRYLNLWQPSHFTATLLWGVSVGLVTLINLNSISEDEHYFRKTALEQVRLLVLLEFFINFYVFDLWVEMVLVPITVFIGGMLAYAESDSKYAAVKRLLDVVMAIFGAALVVFAVYKAVTDFSAFATASTLRDFVLYPLMSLAFLPFTYIAALWVRYEGLFLRLSFFIRDKDLLRYAKRQAMIKINFRLNLLNAWARAVLRLRPESKADILDSLARVKRRGREARPE